MMKCPVCKHAAHTRTSRYITDTMKEIYYQCRNVECSATFKAIESVDRIISKPELIPTQKTKYTQGV